MEMGFWFFLQMYRSNNTSEIHDFGAGISQHFMKSSDQTKPCFGQYRLPTSVSSFLKMRPLVWIGRLSLFYVPRDPSVWEHTSCYSFLHPVRPWPSGNLTSAPSKIKHRTSTPWVFRLLPAPGPWEDHTDATERWQPDLAQATRRFWASVLPTAKWEEKSPTATGCITLSTWPLLQPPKRPEQACRERNWLTSRELEWPNGQGCGRRCPLSSRPWLWASQTPPPSYKGNSSWLWTKGLEKE